MDDYRNGIGDEIPQLARTFFATFIRFEFALKRGGFAAGSVGKPATPNWDDFAAKLGPDFFTRIKGAPEADIFFSNPPKKLMVKVGGGVNFEAVALLTRARQGMVIFVPRGSVEDPTRPPAFYDATHAYLRECGMSEI